MMVGKCGRGPFSHKYIFPIVVVVSSSLRLLRVWLVWLLGGGGVGSRKKDDVSSHAKPSLNVLVCVVYVWLFMCDDDEWFYLLKNYHITPGSGYSSVALLRCHHLPPERWGSLPEDTWKIYNLHLPIPRPGSCLHWRWKLIPSTKIGPFRLSSCVLLCLFDLFSIYIY